MNIKKYGKVKENQLGDNVELSKNFYTQFDEPIKHKEEPEFTESDLYLMDLNKQLKGGEATPLVADDKPSSQETSFNKMPVAQDQPDFTAQGFKSFEIDKIEDSKFSGVFTPILEQTKEENLSSNQSEEKVESYEMEVDQNKKNVFTRNGSQDNINKKDFMGSIEDINSDKKRVQEGDIKITFDNTSFNKDNNTEIIVQIENEVGNQGDIHLIIKDDVVVNETIVIEIDDQESNKPTVNSFEKGFKNENTKEFGNHLLSSIAQSEIPQSKVSR